MIRVYTQPERSLWLQRYRGCSPVFACVLGFTETGLIPFQQLVLPQSRQYTAIADAEFLYNGPQSQPRYPLPPLHAGASVLIPVLVEALEIPVYLFNAGLPQPPVVPAIDLGGTPARCLSQGCSRTATVKHIMEQGLIWGDWLPA